MVNTLKINSSKLKVKDEKALLLDRIHRIEGQIRGIEKMISDDKDCLSVIQQITAVRSALAKVATRILSQESCKVAQKTDKTTFEKIITNLLDFHS